MPGGDRGSGTVLVLAVVAVVVLVAGLLGLLAASLLTHARAQAAADLAALAGAERLQRQVLFGTDAGDPADADGSPCVIASVVAQRNRGRSTACSTGPSGTVTVEVTVDGPLAAARARARAGPRPSTAGS